MYLQMTNNGSRMPVSDEREQAIFTLAVAKPSAKRAAFLDAVCEGDAALRARLEALLAAHDQPEELFGNTAGETTVKETITTAADEALPDEAVGQTLGRYKLLEKIGEGGRGVVYVAEQTEPVRRRVALKVIKLGMDTKQVVARFEAERQALAMMDHPNIAKVLDAGTTGAPLTPSAESQIENRKSQIAEGRPYFVMELVRGIKITDYCDQEKLSTKDRLDLFIKVCHAIQHAHQKGIIHRDIKPSNILVTLHDGVPVPKVIDFGIAKATEGRLTDATVYTQLHQFIGTPAYMSPEQAEMSGLDIDTRSDIYSLGVLLYELLTGKTPFDAQELMSQGIDAMRKTIREKDPLRPSTKLATLKGEELTTTAKRRSAESSTLAKMLRGDLDWIVMKCLEKDRVRRYETANGLAADLKRCLENEPVAARPPSTAYKFQKALRRHKLAFATAAAVVAALVLGVIGTTTGFVRAKRAGALALQSRADAEKLSNFMLDDLYAEVKPIAQFETVARLAQQVVAYYDGLPPALRTPETERNRAFAQARLALITAQNGDIKTATPVAAQAVAKLAQMRKSGDQSEGTAYALALALDADVHCKGFVHNLEEQRILTRRAVEILRPFVRSPQGSRRVKQEYADLLETLSYFQAQEESVASCQEALRVLEGLGALERSDLDAAVSWAATADSLATMFLRVERLDEVERLEREVEKVAIGVLERRPSDLNVRRSLSYGPLVLGFAAAIRGDEAAALSSFQKSRQAAEEYVRFYPSHSQGWARVTSADYSIAALRLRGGQVKEALELLRSAARMDSEHGNAGMNGEGAWIAISRLEAQRGNRDAAAQALAEGRHALELFANRTRMADHVHEYFVARLLDAERQIKLAFDENEVVFKLAGEASEASEWKGAVNDADNPNYSASLVVRRRQALSQASLAALKLRRFADAETHARALLSLPVSHSIWSEPMLLMQPDDLGWARVLLAQSQVAQANPFEALRTLDPAIALYRKMQSEGVSHLTFRQRYARALYVQALAQPADPGGIAQRQSSLAEAAKLLNELSEEARALHDTKELLSWIGATREKPVPEVKQP